MCSPYTWSCIAFSAFFFTSANLPLSKAACSCLTNGPIAGCFVLTLLLPATDVVVTDGPSIESLAEAGPFEVTPWLFDSRILLEPKPSPTDFFFTSSRYTALPARLCASFLASRDTFRSLNLPLPGLVTAG